MRDKILKNKKILIPIIAIILIIAIGMTITITKGLNYDLMYSKNARLSIYMEAEFSNGDIKQIVKEVLGDEKIYIQKSGSSDNIISITAKEISDEQVESIIQKINEKYQTEIDKENYTKVIQNGNTRGRDIIMPYTTQIMIGLMVVVCYLCIMYRKVGVLKALCIPTVLLIITQLLYLSLLAIIRIPINILTMPISLLVLLVTMFGSTLILEKLKGNSKKSQKK